LHLKDFKAAWYSPEVESAKVKISSAYKCDHNTHLIDNAVWVSKQALKYFSECSTPDVAIFDWDAMFIFNFAGMNEKKGTPTFAKGSFFAEQSDKTQSHTFRLLLLGFLVRALQRKKVFIR
jgi:hypothetical protein